MCLEKQLLSFFGFARRYKETNFVSFSKSERFSLCSGRVSSHFLGSPIFHYKLKSIAPSFSKPTNWNSSSNLKQAAFAK
jgi:hypothetical protein